MVGRIEAAEVLEQWRKSKKSEFVAILGRRRVGKTYLIDQGFKDNMCFRITGLQLEDTEAQLENFSRKFNDTIKTSYQIKQPKDWGEAFAQLKLYVSRQPKNKKQVIFIDELPWMATPKSNFLAYLAHFWNDFLSKESHYILVICGSASSWITNKITNHTGGLHNRITDSITLKPFTLAETKLFLESKNINATNQNVAQYYMTFGGIPYYLEGIKRGLSISQNIENLCFSENAKLKNEYDNLYKALFTNPEVHEKIVETLAGSQKGMLRNQLIELSKLKKSGSFNRALDELIECGFIATMPQFGTIKRNEVYRLMDEYSIFYHKFIKKSKRYKIGEWQQMSNSQSYKIWMGYAFELLVYRHPNQVKKKLGISGVYSEMSNFYGDFGDNKSIEIDLIINRNDEVAHYCEMKNYDKPYTFTKKIYDETKAKLRLFKNKLPVKKRISFTMISNEPIIENEYSNELVDNRIVLDDLMH